MEKSKLLKVFTLAGFILLLSGFIAFRSGAFDTHMPDTEQPNDDEIATVASDTPPSQTIDSVKFNPAMMPSSKSIMVHEPKMPFSITIDTIRKKPLKK